MGRDEEDRERGDRPSKRSRRDRSRSRSPKHRSRSRSRSRSPKQKRETSRSRSPKHQRTVSSPERDQNEKKLSRDQSDQKESVNKETRTKEIQAQIAAQMASVTSMLESVKKQQERKAQYRPLLLDSAGREIDEKGNLVRKTEQIKTLAANVASGQAQKKKENPYLSHRGVARVFEHTQNPSENGTPSGAGPILDERIKSSNRDIRAKRAFNFIEAGTFVKQADQQRFKEERKIIAGYSSGRRAPDLAGEDSQQQQEEPEPNEEESGRELVGENDLKVYVPPPPDNGVVPCMEWWDEAFLPKPLREARKRSRAKQEIDDFDQLAFSNCKTVKYIQHPLPVKPLAGDRPDEPLKLYLTKKERKRIRRTAREEREKEKRDKMLMGLIPTPEPKFKLSNFMKILGDQAVADPSKVEKRVIQQMQQRVLNHEMRNLARKLTPTERKEKKRRKLQEDTSRQVHVAIFRVKDFSDPKHRFKVDVNTQQLNLTGTALLCPTSETNLVITEGGPKGIKKIIKLMTKRVAWTQRSENISKRGGVDGETDFYSEPPPGHPTDPVEEEFHEDDKESDDDEQELEEVFPEQNETAADDAETDSSLNNSCDLLWQGIVARRLFHGFRFQECRTAFTARKVLEAKGVAHYWDMAVRADKLLAAENE